MDRDRILRRDFPTARHGYDPAAVDEHLRRVADAYDARPQSLADGASAQVRAILDAAERSADELRAKAFDHVTHVRAAADGVLTELNELLEELGERAERLTARLHALESGAREELPADDEGARLVALNMALDGSPRERIADYLGEHFPALADRDALLDDVYARAAS